MDEGSLREREEGFVEGLWGDGAWVMGEGRREHGADDVASGLNNGFFGLNPILLVHGVFARREHRFAQLH